MQALGHYALPWIPTALDADWHGSRRRGSFGRAHGPVFQSTQNVNLQRLE